MSEDFMSQLGYSRKDLCPLPGKTSIGTAKVGSALEIVGQFREPIYLSLGGGSTKLKTFPVVLKGLASAFNISGPFMKRYNIDQLHSEDSLRVMGKKIPLQSHASAPRHVELITYFQEDEVIPSMSVAHVVLRVSAVENEKMPAGTGIISGEEAFMGKTDLHPWTNTVVTCSKEGEVVAGLMNTLNEPIKIQKGTRYGLFQLTTTIENAAEFPWRICTLEGDVEGVSNPKVQNIATEPDKEVIPSKEDLLGRMRFPVTKFKLDQNSCLDTPSKIARAATLLLKHWEVFSFDGSFGKTHLLKHRILTDPSKPPINQRYRTVNPTLEPDLRKQLDRWLEHGVIEKSSSPWNFGLVAAPKKNGTIRWCVDYRSLNKITLRDTHPIGNIEDNLVRLSRSKIFSGIDGSGAFHVIELEEDDRPKTAFATPWGSFHFTRLPFGLSNGPSTYARLVQMVLDGIPYEIALPFLDDTLIHSTTVENHFSSLDRVLLAHRKAGLKLQPSKCQLFQTEVQYLGHVVSGKGIKPMAEYTAVVQDWPLPRTRTAVRAFLGKVGYYRRFIPNFAGIAKPLMETLSKDETNDKDVFEPQTDFIAAFEALKAKLLAAPILAYPQFHSDEPFILDTDWSHENNAIGAVLSQRQGDHERVIAYGAKRLTKAQQNYSSMKGELAAAIIFMGHWKYYLQFRKFVLRVDNRALKWIHTLEKPTGMVQRWLEILADFDFEVVHRAGKAHANADALSRAPHIPADNIAEDISLGERISALLQALEGGSNWHPESIVQSQEEDADISFLFPFLRTKERPPNSIVAGLSRVGKIYAGLFDSLFLDENGLIRYSKPTIVAGKEIKRKVVILPRNLWRPALVKAHLAAAHMGMNATVDRAQRYLYFPGMAKEAHDLVQVCIPCQQRGGRTPDQRHTLKSHAEGYPFQKISCDFVGPLPTSRKGNKFILTVRDTFSRWLEAFPVRRATASVVVDKLQREIFPRFGICDQLHSDRGSQFTGDLLYDVAQTLGIRLTQTPAYNPKSNPVERAHRDLGAAITALVGQKQNAWEDVLPHALYAMRTAVCRSTGLAPYQLLFGRDPSSDLDLLFGAPQPHPDQFRNHHEYVENLRHVIESAHVWAREHMATTILRQRRAYHKERKPLLEGDLVWLFTPKLRPGQSKKFATYHTGPWIIAKRVNELMYKINPDPTWLRKSPEVVSIDRLRRFYSEELSDPSLTQPPAEDADLSMDGDEYAEFLNPPSLDDDDDEFPAIPFPAAQPALPVLPHALPPVQFPAAPAEAPAQLPPRQAGTPAHPPARRFRPPSPVHPLHHPIHPPGGGPLLRAPVFVAPREEEPAVVIEQPPVVQRTLRQALAQRALPRAQRDPTPEPEPPPPPAPPAPSGRRLLPKPSRAQEEHWKALADRQKQAAKVDAQAGEREQRLLRRQQAGDQPSDGGGVAGQAARGVAGPSRGATGWGPGGREREEPTWHTQRSAADQRAVDRQDEQKNIRRRAEAQRRKELDSDSN
jgi:hypothetical protein